MTAFLINVGIIWMIIIGYGGDCFEAGWRGLKPFTSTVPSSDGTTHYAITECALLRTAADYLKKVYASSALDSIGSTTGVCPKVEDDFDAIAKEAERLGLSDSFSIAAYLISTFDVYVDGREFYKAQSHFDDESFTAGSGLVKARLDDATAELQKENLFNARTSFGKAMHTVQDFYSHSNWIELGKKEPNMYIGSGERLGKYALLSMATCSSCNDTTCAKSNILPDIINGGWLTSGYFDFVSRDFAFLENIGLDLITRKPKGKCSHGGPQDKTTDEDAFGFGINKDDVNSDHGQFFHYQAAQVAYEATRQNLLKLWTQVGDELFGRFLGFQTSSLAFVIDTTGSMGPYIELVKAVAILITKAVAKVPMIRPHTYILSAFNDPGVGPLTVTEDPQALIDAISSLTAAGGGDTPELYYHGLDAALSACEHDSSVFTFTDAPAKDAYLRNQVLSKARELNTRIDSFYAISSIFGRRKRQLSSTDEDIEILDGSDGHDFATATGGFTVGIQPGDSNATAEYVIRRLERPQPLLTLNVAGPTNLTFEVDDTTTVLNIDISSTSQLSGFVQLTTPTGQLLQPSPSAGSAFFHLYTLQNPTPGTWKLYSSNPKKHNIELGSDSSVSCTTTLCELQTGALSSEYMPLLDAPTVNQTNIFLVTLCKKLPANIQNGSVTLTDNLGATISKFHASTLLKNGFITSLSVPDVDFRMLTVVDLVNDTRIQRQTTQVISPTFIKIVPINEPYILTRNSTVNVTFLIYNRAPTSLNITLCITDTLQLLSVPEKCLSAYEIDSLGHATGQLTVSNELSANTTNATSSIFTLTITAPLNDSAIAKKLSNHNTMTVYLQEKVYEEASSLAETTRGNILLLPLCSS